MPDRFRGTMLTKINTQGGLPEDPVKAFGKMSEETDKALLDILKKVNELAGTSADASATGATLSGLGGALSSAIKGMKYGLDVIYISSDTLSILPGAVEVNGELVVCPNALAITPSLPNFPAAGSWAFVTIEKGGTHRLFPATGTAATRPTDNCYLLTGGGVGYNDLGKYGYYYDTARRIIGAIHKVNATTWRIIRNGSYDSEMGQIGSLYRRMSDGTLIIYGINSVTVGAGAVVSYRVEANTYRGSLVITYPVQFLNTTVTTFYSDAYGGAHIASYPTVSGFTIALEANSSGVTAPIAWGAIGVWK